MNLFDVLIVGLVVAGIVGGYRLGMVTRVASWIGMFLGLFLAVRLLPWILERLPRSGGVTSFAVVVGVLLFLAFLGQGIGLWLGSALRPVGDDGTVTVVDRVLGGLAGFVGTVVMIWLLLPLAAQRHPDKIRLRFTDRPRERRLVLLRPRAERRRPSLPPVMRTPGAS